LTLQETAGYLAGRIRAAGGVGAQVFTREAVTLIHQRSKGIPRTISVIADNGLLTGFAVGQRPVNSATVREVCRDFDLDEDGEETLPGREAVTGQTPATRPPGLLLVEGNGAERPRVASVPATPEPARDDEEPRSFGAVAPKRRLFSFLRG
jgi:hypothetical protein